MIAYLRGRVIEKQPTRIIVDVAGVGYDVAVPLSTYYTAGDAGAEITLRVHTHVREDQLALYGFATPLELAVFERLIGVSGIGPKLALAVLSGIEPRELVGAIQRADVATADPHPGRRQEDRRADLDGAARPAAESPRVGGRRVGDAQSKATSAAPIWRPRSGISATIIEPSTRRSRRCSRMPPAPRSSFTFGRP